MTAIPAFGLVLPAAAAQAGPVIGGAFADSFERPDLTNAPGLPPAPTSAPRR
jgi:hypothetical protein